MKALLVTVMISLFVQMVAVFGASTPVYATDNASYELQGMAWTDFNHNNAIDENQPALVNAVICIKQISEMSFGDFGIISDEESDLGTVRLITTDANGQYEITLLKSGYYKVWLEATGSEEAAVTVTVGDSESVLSPAINIPAQARQVFIPFTVR